MSNSPRPAAAAHHWRPDIDGLRAIAVVPVVLFHYRLPFFSGGYVGVDVFFVISGYLITSLIYGEMTAGTFSILTFYERRVRRIYPALFFVLLATSIASLLLLLPSDLIRFGKSLVATTFFVSNFQFWQESGYFDVGAVLKPLLHTWSLAIEEQFYLAFPVLLFLIRRYPRPIVLILLLLAFCASFGFSVWATNHYPSTSFYVTPSRAWELLLGSILAIWALPDPKNITIASMLAAIGVGMIGYSVSSFTSDTPFPGLSAALPCFGAALVIHSGKGGHSLVNQALSFPPLVFIGLISYSLYLWHWPFFVFGSYYAIYGLTSVQKLALITASIFSAWFSWRFVEKPFRVRNGVLDRRGLFILAAVVMAITALAGSLVFVLRGIPSRFSPEVRILSEASSDFHHGTQCLKNVGPELRAAHLCQIGTDTGKKPDFLVWGDSLSYALLPAIEKAATNLHRRGLSAEHDGCPPLLGVERSSTPGCAEFNNAALNAALANNIRNVLLISRWAINSEGTRYGNEPGRAVVLFDVRSNMASATDNHAVFLRGLEATIQRLREGGKQVTIVESTPEIGWDVPQTLAKMKLLHVTTDIAPTVDNYLSRQAFVFSTVDRLRAIYGIAVAEPHQYLCGRNKCPLEMNGIPLYSDDHHVTTYGAMKLLPMFLAVL